MKSKVFLAAEEFKKEFRKSFQNVFTNDEIAYHMTYLAMTGEEKFGKNSPAAADTFLAVSHDGNTVKLHSNKDKKYISSMKVRPSYRLRAQNPKKGLPHLQSIVVLSAKKLLEAVDMNEELLAEIEWLSLWKRFTNAVKKMIDRALSWVGNSWQRLLEFLGYELDITFNPKW